MADLKAVQDLAHGLVDDVLNAFRAIVEYRDCSICPLINAIRFLGSGKRETTGMSCPSQQGCFGWHCTNKSDIKIFL